MIKKITALLLCLLMAVAAVGCAEQEKKEKEDKQEEKYPEIGEKIAVSKLVPAEEEWVLEKEGELESYALPQFNLKSETAEKYNKEIIDKAKEGAKNGLRELRYSYGEKEALLSLTIALIYPESTEYLAYNISLTDGKTPSNESIMQHFGLKPYQFRAICSEVITFEYNSLYYSFSDSNPELYREGLDRSRSVEHLKKITPYVSAGGRLCFISKVFGMTGEEFYINKEAEQRSLDNGSF